MIVTYDTNIKIAGIGMVPWTRLGPERWLRGYAIASLYGWDRPDHVLPRVVALSDMASPLPELPKINTASLLRNHEFQQLLRTHFPDHALLTYKPVEIPPELSDMKFLFADAEFTARFENKVMFREIAHGVVRFPAYRIYQRDQLLPTEEAYRLVGGRRNRFVIQDEQLSGGRGSFIVSDYRQYRQAVGALQQLSSHQRVVVSDVIDQPKERSIQCCVTKYGVYIGPLQRQIVAHPLLANLANPGGDKYCGAQVSGSDQTSSLYPQAVTAARTIGDMLMAEGYRGIFGIDFLADEHDELFVLEVNPRITGVTPLLTAAYQPGDVPFYLLHLLALGGYDYTVRGTPRQFSGDCSLLVVHSLSQSTVRIVSAPTSGTYQIGKGNLIRVGDGVNISKLIGSQFVVQTYMPPGMSIKPGGRLITVQCNRPVIHRETDGLLEETVCMVQAVRQAITTELA